MKDTLNNHSTESDSQSGYEKLIAECEADDRPLREQVLEYSDKAWHEDCAEYVISDDIETNADLRELLKEAVKWHRIVSNAGTDTYSAIVNDGLILTRIATDIGIHIINNLYATTEGK